MTTLLCIFALVLAVGCLVIALWRNHSLKRELNRLEIAACGSRRKRADRRIEALTYFNSLNDRVAVRRNEDRQ